MGKPVYTWDNDKHDWSDDDEYVIFRDGRVMEPGEVVDALNRYEDLQEQIAQTMRPYLQQVVDELHDLEDGTL